MKKLRTLKTKVKEVIRDGLRKEEKTAKGKVEQRLVLQPKLAKYEALGWKIVKPVNEMYLIEKEI